MSPETTKSSSMSLTSSQNFEKSDPVEEINKTLFSETEELQKVQSSDVENMEDSDSNQENSLDLEKGKKEPLNKVNAILEEFQKEFDSLANPEEKVHYAIEFMRHSLAQNGSPFFKGFWEARKLCLPFFKELTGQLRNQLWNEYIELTKEGRRLKTLLDEESAFAVEQIEMAINALEQEVSLFETSLPTLLEKSTPIQFSQESEVLKVNQAQYISIQEQLNFLNVYASRINALRKELIKTEIRIRQKNKFFQRLSLIGDKVFPKRKELIKEISDLFLDDVKRFVEGNFSERNFVKEKIQKSLFYFREEIKSLQSIAKILTLNTFAFSSTREHLSKAWDQLKGMEKEIRKEVAQQKAVYRHNVDSVREKFAQFSEQFASGQLPLNEAFKQLEEIVIFMRNTQLGREDVRQLREEFKEIKRPVLELSEKIEAEKRSKEQLIEQEKREKHQLIRNRIDVLSQKVDSGDLDELSKERELLLNEVNSSSLTKGEKQILERNLKRIRDVIAERKEKAVVELSESDRQSLDQLQEILNQRKERRSEIKAQIEEYRKVVGSSGLDFEKAMSYNEQMAVEKERLEKINEGIQEIEAKISEFKKKN